MAKRFFVRAADVPTYHPANHSGTTNRRLIGPETVGAKNVEVLLGVIEKGEGATTHAHPGMEQVCYLLEGSATVELEGERREMRPGDACLLRIKTRDRQDIIGFHDFLGQVPQCR